MNFVPLNDRGQFRYADFVEYIPDFLQEEPDVVALLQVMSDYINDAYRNIEDVEEFEFKLCVAEPKVDRAMRKLEQMRTMFSLADSRDERVYYLSVPRANVKSNVVLGKDTGRSPYYVEVEYSEVKEEIERVGSIDRRVLDLDDGDVVFVRYRSMELAVVKSYYLCKARGSLVLDPEGTTQDPFTDTDNSENRMISFRVSDISSVGKRFGKEISGTTYYEVFFTARVSEVSSAPAVQTVTFDADEVDGSEDSLVVDYYGMTYTPRDRYYTSLSFYGQTGWAWKNGFPTGIFYLKDTSSAKLVPLDGIGMGEMPEDPTLSLKSVRYALSSDGTFNANTGTWVFSTAMAIPQVDGGRLYAIERNSGRCVGEFVQIGSATSDGGYTVRARATWCDYSDTLDKANIFLVAFPLYFNRGIPDYETSRPLITWKVTDSSIVDWTSARFERCVPSGTEGVRIIGETPVEVRDSRSFEVPAEFAERMVVDGVLPELFCGGTMWDGLLKVRRISRTGNGGALVTMAAGIRAPSTDSVTLSTGYVGAMRVDPDGSCTWLEPSTSNLLGFMAGTGAYFLVGYGEDGSVVAATVTGYGGATYAVKLDRELPEGIYACATLRAAPDTGYADSLKEPSLDDAGYWHAVCDRYKYDVFSTGIFRITDKSGNIAYALVGNQDRPVRKFAVGESYSPNDLVFYIEPGQMRGDLYTCVIGCTPVTGDRPSAMGEFRLDRVAGYRLSYGTAYNRFMPYYGQVKALGFGEGVDYSGDMDVTTTPLYITKVVENRLKYGWEHREFLNYGTMMDMNGRDRNGSVDIFSCALSDGGNGLETSMDVVTATIGRKAAWHIGYPVVRHGSVSYQRVDVDNHGVIPVEYTGNAWRVTVDSAGHGLLDGALVRVSGFNSPDTTVNINGYFSVDVHGGDSFSFDIPTTVPVTGVTSRYEPITVSGKVEYVADYRASITSVSRESTNGIRVAVPEGVVVAKAGDHLSICNLDADMTDGDSYGTYAFTVTDVVRGAIGITDLYGTVSPEFFDEYTSGRLVLTKTIKAGDYVTCGDSVFHVTDGMWVETEDKDIVVPSVLVSKENLCDVSLTNPQFALGDDLRIESIEPEGPSQALVRLKDMIPHFNADNAGIIEGRTMVKIRNVSPAQYNGWHTVTQVVSPRVFRITVRIPEELMARGAGVNGGQMYLNEGRWYAFAVKEVEWDKVSNRVTYSLSNKVSSENVETGIAITEFPHGLSKGDYVIAGDYSKVVEVDSSNVGSMSGVIGCYRVSALSGSTGVRLENLDGSPVSGLTGKAIARGVVLSDPMDDIGSLRGEYTRALASLDGAAYRFRTGDIVVALAQQNPCEVKTWKVVSGAEWQPVRAKRSMKIRSLGVYSYPNGKYDGTDVDSGEAPDKYETYSDVDIAGFDGDVYMAGFRCISKANFALPSLEGMDTTRGAMAEYSSGEDFSNVAPRTHMSKSFKGVPSMKYPLVEKIERLCYLRDARVIDYDLIEYLARFLGYDITPLGDDVTESSLYRTKREREEAIRETVASLPYYYSLGGTKTGLNMLMHTFGVISEVITLWTDARNPYKELVSQDEAVYRTESGMPGNWVPTTFIDMAVTNVAGLPQFSVRQSDVERLREQIRVFKPINVVFRDFVFRVVDNLKVNSCIAIAGISGSNDCGAVTSGCCNLEIDESDPELSNCAF